jgi:hypothetical protein
MPFAVCHLPFAIYHLPFAICQLPVAVSGANASASASAGWRKRPGGAAWRAGGQLPPLIVLVVLC